MRIPVDRSMREALVVVAIVLVGASTPVLAQSNDTSTSDGGAKWSLIDGVGYGGLGFGLGVLATWDMESDDFGPPTGALVIIGAATAAGTVAGAMIGRRAQQMIAEERPLHGAHCAAVIGGGVLAGATLGALTSAALISDQGQDTFLGSDEQTFTLLVLAGSALGSLYVWRHRDELSPREVGLAPAIGGRGRYGLRLRVSF